MQEQRPQGPDLPQQHERMQGLLRFRERQRNKHRITHGTATRLPATVWARAARDGVCASPRVRWRRRGPPADGSCVLLLVQAGNSGQVSGACYRVAGEELTRRVLLIPVYYMPAF